jgi:hypothetical protein
VWLGGWVGVSGIDGSGRLCTDAELVVVAEASVASVAASVASVAASITLDSFIKAGEGKRDCSAALSVASTLACTRVLRLLYH